QEAITGFYEWILQHEKTTASDLPFGQRAIVKQYRITVEALLRWAEETLNEYKELNKESK
ncbi:MAG TPA: hypothetical protein VFM05_12135, partial [Candidatus Saccharimonadales bacterium]|nr:hypothetical protein [Candidatus Saccharimonadales bacterium]